MSRNVASFIAVGIVLFGLSMAACSSTGYSTRASLVVPRTIRAPANIPPEIVPYVPRFVEALRARGFAVGKTDDSRALDLVFEFNGNPFNLRVSAGLWNQGVPVVTGSATNSGWGTALARGSAVRSLIGKAAKQFSRELDVFVSRVRIVPDAKQGTAEPVTSPNGSHKTDD